MPQPAADQFQALWIADISAPDVFAFLEQHNDLDREAQLAVLRCDQQRRWQTDQPLKVEDYLARLPDLAGDSECKAELAVGEFQARQNGKSSPSLREFLSRFPDISDTLRQKLADSETSREKSSLAATATFDSTQLDQRVGRYRILRVLGEGAFGRVMLAFDEELERQVAIKVPKPERFQTPEDAELYLAEARTVAGLDHPHIVPVYDMGRSEDDSVFVVSKFIEGCDLKSLIEQDRPSPDVAAKLLAVVAQALHHAHQKRLIHRDIKPANILIEEATRTPYVADFGLAIKEEDYLKSGNMAGTPAYMSPEQARAEGHRLDGRSDIFSVGIVFYELLTGKRPFRGSSSYELMVQISTTEPRPPRELESSLPAELERICLKALAKRASDRYPTAADLADDLLHWNDTPQQEHQELQIVPKGLRSFDAEDAGFFLDLLPGPRNREGLPESIAFWKSRIEEPDAEKTFAVGLIYGPSGCGKSSLVKAGLLPRLSNHIIALYIEATPDDTETRILRGLRKHLPDLPADLGLVETFMLLRRDAGRKVVIVLDQFEQWLHAHRTEQDTELVNALRQCDGGQLQAVVMVRDDFAMAAARLMKELETRIVEGQNFATVDLFDVDHAGKVLVKFGQAFGKLPAQTVKLSDDEKTFVDAVAEGLAQDGMVVSVRLALFAEMVKGKPWTPTTLEDVGGTEGIGVNFLEETFSSRNANPEHRLHQQAAREVLKCLLPDVGTDIKGHMRSHAELLEASGDNNRPKDFEELLRILDGELRLITPTDPEGFESDSDSDPHTKYYQLTHDYLVPSLREWLTRKQKETKKGRAELRLAERSALWNAKPENRHLPSWWEWFTIRRLTDRKKWTLRERQMMKRSGRFHGLRWGLALIFLCAVGFGVNHFLTQQGEYVVAQELKNDRKRAKSLVEAVLTAPPQAVPFAIQNLEPLKQHAIPILQQHLADAETHPSQRLHAACALSQFGHVEVEVLVSSINSATGAEVGNIAGALTPARESALVRLKAEIAKANESQNWERKFRHALVALWLGDPQAASEMCALTPDPVQRTTFIHNTFPQWHGDLTELAMVCQNLEDGPLRSALCLGLGGVSQNDITAEVQAAWKPLLMGWYQTASDSGTHGAADWALRQWKIALPEIQPTNQPIEDRLWFVNSLGMTLLKLPAGKFRMGSDSRLASSEEQPVHVVTLTRPFYLSDREVTVGQFLQFINDPDCPASEKPEDWEGYDKSISLTEQHPIQQVSWYDAVLYCNWLSRREGRRPCYEGLGTGWKLVSSGTGYRIPTEAEWEYACRAGTSTEYCFGDAETLLPQYAVFNASHAEACGEKLPNAWGLFDLHGNVYEWCYDGFGNYSAEPAENPTGNSMASGRVFRGGGWSYAGWRCRSAGRSGFVPGLRDFNQGFRLAAVPSRE